MTTGTNLQLQYDETTDSWSYQNVDYEYAPASTNSWSGYTSPDPDFKFAPKEEEQQQEQDNDTVCPPGYIYDEGLKQCLPDPEYRAPSYAAEPTGGREDEPEQQNYVDFRDMSYDDMVQFGKNEGYFNEAGTFIGAQESNVPFPFIKGISQFGLNSEANRFAINFAKKGGKVWNPNEPSFIGNLYIPKNDDLAKFITNPILWSNYAVNSAKTKPIETVQSIVSNPRIKLEEEKLKQETEKTKQQEIKTQQMVDDAIARSDSKTTVTGADKGAGSRPSKDSTYLINQKDDKGMLGRRNESAYRAAIEKNIKANPGSYSKKQGGFTKGR